MRVGALVLAVLVAGAGLQLHVRFSGDRPPSDPDLRAAVGHALAQQEAAADLSRDMDGALDAGEIDRFDEAATRARLAGIAVPPDLAARRAEADRWPAWTWRNAQTCAAGFWSGRSEDGTGLACAIASDFMIVGDLRDLGRAASGEEVSPWLVGLAGAGVAMTGATIVSAGAGAPLRGSLSVLKAAVRSRAVAPGLLRTLLGSDRAVAAAARADVASIVRHASPAAALRLLKAADKAEDLPALRRLARVFGDDATVVVKALGKRSVTLAKGTTRLGLRLMGALGMIVGTLLTALLAALSGWLGLRALRHICCCIGRWLLGGWRMIA
ncbi:hypothetical protein [Marinivivus vitaminiproducens]|uniref:hypothetical protein n=1 Tax=Marinivivus vitaminiproducens TaxID=3035935 RepID=UPI0027998A39|nr:hypothetical protein P4R82_14410 [Geminicoccaceae bacterium SCSIO 64248]